MPITVYCPSCGKKIYAPDQTRSREENGRPWIVGVVTDIQADAVNFEQDLQPSCGQGFREYA